MDAMTENHDIAKNCDCRRCACAERDRLKELFEVSEFVRQSEEMTLRGLYGENYDLKQELLETKKQLEALRMIKLTHVSEHTEDITGRGPND